MKNILGLIPETRGSEGDNMTLRLGKFYYYLI